MSDRSSIEWTDATWNPVRGCVKVSPGCKHCYAETFAERFRGVPGHPFEQGFDLRLVPEKLDVPLRWRSPRRIFVNSMSDLFQDGVPTEYIAEVGRMMQAADWHTYQVLTKRHVRMQDSAVWRTFVARPIAARLVRRQRREPAARPASYQCPARDTGEGSVPFDRAAPRRSWSARLDRHRLGDRRRRERSGRSADEGNVGYLNPRPVPRGRCALLLQTMGRGAEVAQRESVRPPHVE